MDVVPSQSEIFMLTDADRRITPGGPALIGPAAAIGMPRRDLRSYIADGEIPFRSSEYVDWVRLADVLAFNQRLKAQRREALDEMLSEPLWEDGDDAGPAADSDQ